jgi:2,3-bisphosphoglycerate-dependent phosphoglycerate mutase
MYKIILVRHGQSVYNAQNLFTGWTDVELSEKGVAEAKNAGKILSIHGLEFDLAITSVLKRSEETLWEILDELEQEDMEIISDWRLNERHYGDLQGKNKTEIEAEFGLEQLQLWRRSFSIRPPGLEVTDPRNSANDSKYEDLESYQIPLTESLEDTTKRVIDCWNEVIIPELKMGKNILITAHGNSLRGLIKYLENISDIDIVNLEIPTGSVIAIEFDDNLNFLKRNYLD